MSAPVPPVMVSMLAIVTVPPKLPRVRVSLPAARSTEALETPAARVMVSAAVPPVRVSMLATVAVLAKLARVRVSVAGGEVDGGVGDGWRG